jgi:hypothetical protein
MIFPVILLLAFIAIAMLPASTCAFQSSLINTRSLRRTTFLQATEYPLYHHHTCIRTRNIEVAVKFYSLFGYKIETKFRAGPARAAWLTTSSGQSKKGHSDAAARLEIIEVPSYVLDEEEGTIKRALDLIKHESLLGLNHFALDVTPHIESLQKEEYYGLDQFLEDINEISKEKFGKTLRVALYPRQQVIGNQVFELCFIYDADGCVVELVRFIKDLDQNIQSGWEPWDGSGFVGADDRKTSP